MADTKQMVVTVTAETHRAIVEIAEHEGIPQAQVMRDLLETGLPERRKLSRRRRRRV